MKRGFFIGQYKKSWETLKQSKNYIWFAVILFFLVTIIGFIFPVFFVDEIMGVLEKLVLEFEGLGVFETILKIFLNNLQASFLSVVFGVILGLFPLSATIINGYVLGFVARHSVAEKGVFVLWRILPHGIFELPAVLISIGLGFWLGVSILKRGVSWSGFKKKFVDAVRVFVFIVIPLLVVAGVIEGVLVVLVG